jgi:hypothetical protein
MLRPYRVSNRNTGLIPVEKEFVTTLGSIADFV